LIERSEVRIPSPAAKGATRTEAPGFRRTGEAGANRERARETVAATLVLRQKASELARLATNPLAARVRPKARRLLDVLGRLVSRGDTLVVIEHRPQVMASADWLIELGPEGGDAGAASSPKGRRATSRRRKRRPAAF